MPGRKKIATILVVSAVAVGGALAYLRQAVVDSQPPVALPLTVPFDASGDGIVLQGKINGADVTMVLDTGASMTVVDSGWAQEHPIQEASMMDLLASGAGQVKVMHGSDAQPPAGSGAAGATQTGPVRVQVAGAGGDGHAVGTGGAPTSLRLGKLESLQLPGLELRGRLVGIMALSGVWRSHGRPFQAILGRDFLSRYVVEIDYRAERLKLRSADEFHYEGPGEILPVSLGTGVPRVEARVTLSTGESFTGKMDLDTGASGIPLRLMAGFVSAHPELQTGASARVPIGRGTGGISYGRVTRIKTLTLGKLVVNEPVTALTDDKTGVFATSGLDGNIGGALFWRGKLIVDYKRNRMILEPGPDFNAPYTYDMSGMGLEASGSDLQNVSVFFVMPGGPAAEAGVLTGDQVVAVNGAPATGPGLVALRQSLRKEGMLALSVLREGKPMQLTVKLRRLV